MPETTKLIWPWIIASRQNSDVFPAGSVAVAEMNCPGVELAGTVVVKLALPVASVVTCNEPTWRLALAETG